MQALTSYLANIDQLTTISKLSDKQSDEYIHPKLKNLGSVSIVVIREAIAPVIFRNAEEEITDIEWLDELYIRAVPNKFKYIERGRGLQILRAYGVGGKCPQNKTVILKSQKPSEAFDLNTLVFGDSANQDNRVLPVRAAINYSDALSLLPKDQCVDETFHNRAAEDGTLFDAVGKKNSDNLFTRHFILPGTLMIQVISTRGQLLPEIGLKHLLLSIGMAGSYGGQTSAIGVNIRTHMVGAYASQFEQAITSPYEILRELKGSNKTVITDIKQAIHSRLESSHDVSILGKEIEQWQTSLINDFNNSESTLEKEYKQAQPKVAALFDQWFQ